MQSWVVNRKKAKCGFVITCLGMEHIHNAIPATFKLREHVRAA